MDHRFLNESIAFLSPESRGYAPEIVSRLLVTHSQASLGIGIEGFASYLAGRDEQGSVLVIFEVEIRFPHGHQSLAAHDGNDHCRMVRWLSLFLCLLHHASFRRLGCLRAYKIHHVSFHFLFLIYCAKYG